MSQEPQPEYVSWKVGADILGVTRGVFFHYVGTNQIAIEPGNRKRNRRYRLLDIQNIKKRRDSGQKRGPYKKRERSIVFDWIRPEDIPAVLELDYTVYHEMYLADAERYIGWRKKNLHLSQAAFDARDRRICLGYIGLLPLPEETIHAVLRGDRDETSLTANDILTYEQPGGYNLLANSAVIHPDHPDLLIKIVNNITQFWINEQYPHRYILKVYAQAVTSRGDQFVQHFRMAPRYDLGNNAFELDLARPGLTRIIRNFQSALIDKAPLPAELCRYEQ